MKVLHLLLLAMAFSLMSCKKTPTGNLDKDLKTYEDLLRNGSYEEAEEFREKATFEYAKKVKGLN